MKQIYRVLTLLTLMGSAAAADSGPFDFEFEEVANGVWAGVRPDSPKFPVMGNTTFVISDKGVVVFDGGGMPVMAEKIIDKIRSITDQAVTHVVISHWHGDHNFGIYRFAEEFPNVQFVAHSFTDRAMNGSPVEYIKNYAIFDEIRLPQYRTILETGKDADGNLKYRKIRQDAALLKMQMMAVDPDTFSPERRRDSHVNIVVVQQREGW